MEYELSNQNQIDMPDHIKTVVKTMAGYSVSWINISISGLNEILGLLVGVLTSIYLVFQIRKTMKNTNRKKP